MDRNPQKLHSEFQIGLEKIGKRGCAVHFSRHFLVGRETWNVGSLVDKDSDDSVSEVG
jgi:hypothetical protein